MAELATLARPYAKAAFDYALTHSNPSAWENALISVSGAVADPSL